MPVTTAEPTGDEASAVWRVLLVDDEPAVHELSRLILADLVFEGRTVELLSAGSAAQARECLARHGDIALVLLDVVMETDDAGIALVEHIRHERQDHDVQIVLRTGQPGMAPEREVVLRYEINGYCLKTDLTAQRLQSVVVSALRGYRHARTLRGAGTRDAGRLTAGTEGARAALAAEIVPPHAGGSVLIIAQPEVLLVSQQVTGVELVPQWKTTRGLLPAVRVAELLPPGPQRREVVLWLLSEACQWARTWADGSDSAFTVSVPLIVHGREDADTLRAMLDLIGAAGLPRGMLDLLVREATLFDGDPHTQGALTALRALGVTLTLVDFGASTIALQPLNRLLPDRLKIHRVYVRDVAADLERMTLARSLIALAHSLNIIAIADGIASDADAQFFRWEGCELGQGDALAPGCSLADVADYLRNGPRVAS